MVCFRLTVPRRKRWTGTVPPARRAGRPSRSRLVRICSFFYAALLSGGGSADTSPRGTSLRSQPGGRHQEEQVLLNGLIFLGTGRVYRGELFGETQRQLQGNGALLLGSVPCRLLRQRRARAAISAAGAEHIRSTAGSTRQEGAGDDSSHDVMKAIVEHYSCGGPTTTTTCSATGQRIWHS